MPNSLPSFSINARQASGKSVACRAWDDSQNTQPRDLTWNVLGSERMAGVAGGWGERGIWETSIPSMPGRGFVCLRVGKTLEDV